MNRSMAIRDVKTYLVDHIGVVVVSGCDDGMSPQTCHGSVPFLDLAMLHEPSGRLRAKPNPGSQNEGRDECRSELETPGYRTSIFDNHVGTESKEDSSHNP